MATAATRFGHDLARGSRSPETEKKRLIKCIIDTSAFEDEEGVCESYGPQFSAIRSLSPEGDIADKLRTKERRPRSVVLNMLEAGDSLKLAENPRIAAVLAKNGKIHLKCLYNPAVVFTGNFQLKNEYITFKFTAGGRASRTRVPLLY